MKILNTIRRWPSQLWNTISASSFLSIFLASIVILILVTLIIVVIYFSIEDDSQSRLGFLQLIVAFFGSIATIIAVVLAGYELESARLKPNLDIFFQENDGILVKTLTVHHQNALINVNIVLKNESRAVAEFIKVEIDFQRTQCLDLAKTSAISLFQKHQYFRFWRTNISEQARLQALFSGGRDFILYAEDEESVGRVQIMIPNIKQTEEITVPYRIRAQRMMRKDGHLTILIRNRDRQI